MKEKKCGGGLIETTVRHVWQESLGKLGSIHEGAAFCCLAIHDECQVERDKD